ncbi:MAG: hypothetical protein ACLGRW_11970, partial [Acidobacteriota bacterium]
RVAQTPSKQQQFRKTGTDENLLLCAGTRRRSRAFAIVEAMCSRRIAVPAATIASASKKRAPSQPSGVPNLTERALCRAARVQRWDLQETLGKTAGYGAELVHPAGSFT